MAAILLVAGFGIIEEAEAISIPSALVSQLSAKALGGKAGNFASKTFLKEIFTYADTPWWALLPMPAWALFWPAGGAK